MSRATRLAVSTALAFGLALAAAPAASAHAILLRTEPSPQTTVKQSPTAVKLHFSEAVEAAFGAVRLFDVDGHRVDSGKLSRADSDKEVDLPVPHLKDGSYTLTWRSSRPTATRSTAASASTSGRRRPSRRWPWPAMPASGERSAGGSVSTASPGSPPSSP